MNIKIVEKVPFSEYKRILTHVKFEWLRNAWDTVDTVVTLAAIDDDPEETTRGYCILVTQNYSKDTAVLLYVFVEEDYRDKGIATEMVKQGVFQLRDWGYKSIALSIPEELPGALFERVGFRRLRKETHMIYNGFVLLTSKVGKDLEKMAPYRKFVKKEHGLSPTEKKKFRQTVLGAQLHIDIDKIDPERTRYFVDKNNHILACMPTVIDENGFIIILDLYIERVEESKMAIPCMMVDLLSEHKASGHLKDDTRITISLTSEQNIQAMRQAFGEPYMILNENVMVM